jgi:predicted enzyme related to lactoylglutathione lyase
MTTTPLSLLEFPADDPDRARRFWASLLGVELDPRQDGEGRGWQTHSEATAGAQGPAAQTRVELGIHERGTGPGDTFSLPYFTVTDIATTLEQVRELGGSVVHPGERWAICKDSEGTPFGVASGD